MTALNAGGLDAVWGAKRTEPGQKKGLKLHFPNLSHVRARAINSDIKTDDDCTHLRCHQAFDFWKRGVLRIHFASSLNFFL